MLWLSVDTIMDNKDNQEKKKVEVIGEEMLAESLTDPWATLELIRVEEI